jgi:hypothetical protein
MFTFFRRTKSVRTTTTRQKATSWKPRLEVLEDRVVPSAFPLLKVDIDSNRGAPQILNPSPTLPGFQRFVLSHGGGSSTFSTVAGNITASVSKVGPGGLSPRDREVTNQSIPTGVTSYSGSPVGDLFRDFIQADASTTAHGMNLAIGGLAPDTPYQFRLWSHDSLDPGKLGRSTRPEESCSWTISGLSCRSLRVSINRP